MYLFHGSDIKSTVFHTILKINELFSDTIFWQDCKQILPCKTAVVDSVLACYISRHSILKIPQRRLAIFSATIYYS